MKVFQTSIRHEPFATRSLALDRRLRRKASSQTVQDVVGRTVEVAGRSTADLVVHTDTQTSRQVQHDATHTQHPSALNGRTTARYRISAVSAMELAPNVQQLYTVGYGLLRNKTLWQRKSGPCPTADRSRKITQNSGPVSCWIRS